MLQLKVFSDPKSFLEKTEDLLMEKEAENNFPLGKLGELILDPGPENYLLAMLEKGGKPVMVFIKTGGPLIISGDEDFFSQGIDLFAKFSKEENLKIPGVFGPTSHVKSFVEKWEEFFPIIWREIMEQRIFRLDKPRIEPGENGKLRTAQEKDIEQVTQWVEMFSKEADPGGEIPPALAREKAEWGIKKKEFFLWEKGKPVSMAKKARPTKNGVAITMVYTPEEYRKKGYGTSCVTALSKKLLGEGYKFCTLFTDAKNPTSNKIYEAIGFREIGFTLIGKFLEKN